MRQTNLEDTTDLIVLHKRGSAGGLLTRLVIKYNGCQSLNVKHPKPVPSGLAHVEYERQ